MKSKAYNLSKLRSLIQKLQQSQSASADTGVPERKVVQQDRQPEQETIPEKVCDAQEAEISDTSMDIHEDTEQSDRTDKRFVASNTEQVQQDSDSEQSDSSSSPRKNSSTTNEGSLSSMFSLAPVNRGKVEDKAIKEGFTGFLVDPALVRNVVKL